MNAFPPAPHQNAPLDNSQGSEHFDLSHKLA